MSSVSPHRRILFLGPTGIDKAAVAARASEYISELFNHQIRFVDFEKEFLKQQPTVKDWMTFLNQDIPLQSLIWQQAWGEFKKTLTDEITILGLHATYVSGVMGLRCALNIPSVCKDFNPTLIISLIDDVYSMWSRTERRAEGEDRKGRPTFEQLLVARRAEQILGDVILAHAPTSGVRHVVCATKNAIDALANIIVFNSSVTYLSFPISAPREMMKKKNDSSFIEIINRAHRLAVAEMKQDRTRSFISPLAIDELPMLKKMGKRRKGLVSFNGNEDRWNPDELWGNPAEPILNSVEVGVKLPVDQVSDAAGVINTDVGWRDRRLVIQSKSLAIICPKDPRKEQITRGVEDEIYTATPLGIVCYYWQKPEWDRKNFLERRFPAAGSIGNRSKPSASSTSRFARRTDPDETVRLADASCSDDQEG